MLSALPAASFFPLRKEKEKRGGGLGQEKKMGRRGETKQYFAEQISRKKWEDGFPQRSPPVFVKDTCIVAPMRRIARRKRFIFFYRARRRTSRADSISSRL
jgi:hypothetical protein